MKVSIVRSTEQIKNYILFLKNNCGLDITLHPFGNEKLISSGELITFNIHSNSYCIFVKTNEDANRHCVDCQQKVRDKCRYGAFCGTCYAGVREYVYPIFDGGDVAGFLCVSGYASEDALSYIKKASSKYALSYDKALRAYDSLKTQMPSKKEVDTLVSPLLAMLELAYIKSAASPDTAENLAEKIVRYVKRNHTRNMSIDDICAEFSCSRSYVSRVFKKHTGKTVGEYLTFARIADARNLLDYSTLSVTEIAFSVGFSDSNYFSNVFRKHTGMSPREYRINFGLTDKSELTTK